MPKRNSRSATPVADDTRGAAARGKLAEALLDHFLSGGSPEGSVRSFAAAVGVSHSLLLYHFHSQAGVLAAVHLVCEQREREHFAALQLEAEDPADVMHAMWRHLADPQMWPVYRVGFALRLRADVSAEAQTEVRDAWVDTLEPLAALLHLDGNRAQDEALLWVATCRGLLWELITGADPARVHRAAARFFAHYE